MGGLGPGIGASELFVIGVIALLVVGPKELPGLMRKVGQWMARARNMAAEFRASFDEMARQSELEELRKEVEALKSANPVHRLGAEADAAFRDIRDGLNAPATPKAAALAAPDPVPAMTPIAPAFQPGSTEPEPVSATKPGTRARASAAKTAGASKAPAKAPSKAKAAAKPRKSTVPAKKAPPKRTRKVEL